MSRLSKVVALATGVLGVVGLSAPASADGYVGRGYAAPFSWNGYYIGINGGYGFSGDDDGVVWRETNNTVPFFGPANAGSLDIAGGFGGLQIGANHQFGAIVVGLEADAQGGNITDSTPRVITTPYLVAGGTAAMASKSSVNWFGTVRGRLGFAFGQTLIYGTGGLAWGEVKHSMVWDDSNLFRAFDHNDTMRIGWVAGGGIEHAFTSRWSLKAEYQYIDLGSQKYTAAECFPAFCANGLAAAPLTGAATAFAVHTRTDTDFHTLRLGLNYKFDDRRVLEPLK